MEEKISRKDIFNLYNVYATYKFYYDYYWNVDKPAGKTKKEIEEKIDYILKNKLEAGTPFDYLCWFAGLNPYDVKDMNGIDVLRAIERENYVD